jgi:hypothetical protein
MVGELQAGKNHACDEKNVIMYGRKCNIASIVYLAEFATLSKLQHCPGAALEVRSDVARDLGDGSPASALHAEFRHWRKYMARPA